MDEKKITIYYAYKMRPLLILDLSLIISIVPASYMFNCSSKTGPKLVVHVVPHSHDDTGWVKTFNEYYNQDVSKIISSVVSNLQDRPNRTFIQVEMSFFKKWWHQQNTKTQDIVRQLIKKKQFEFTSGGWCMNDEATVYYNSIIDQMTLGLQFINETFGESARPTIAWQIDPFGHSAEQASLFSLMSFDALFMARIQLNDLKKRRREKRMEFVWKGSKSYGSRSQIFTSLLYNHYTPPIDLCHTRECNKAFDTSLLLGLYIGEMCKQANSYQTNHLLLPLGDDFAYKKAGVWYKAIDELIGQINKEGTITAIYSTPSRYIKEILKEKKTWGIKTDDFFPYTDDDVRYWTGYFTSRQTFKRYVRESDYILQACKQVEVMLGGNIQKRSSLALREAVAVTQHHDAITGTEKEYVLKDYKRMLDKGRRECQDIISSFVGLKLTRSSEINKSLRFQTCDYLNISKCPITETEDSIIMNLYNPIAREVVNHIRLPVKKRDISVFSPSGELIELQMVQIFTGESLKINSKYEVVFQVRTPPLGFATYFIGKRDNDIKRQNSESWTALSNGETLENKRKNIVLENSLLKVEFSGDSGQILRMSRKDDNLTVHVNQRFLWYKKALDSGAYVCHPRENDTYQIKFLTYKVIRGAVVQKVYQEYSDSITQTIRLFNDSSFIELEYTVRLNDYGELFTLFNTSIESKGQFYSDSNGREMIKRKRNSNLTCDNLYPVTSRIFIKDSKVQFTVATDRSQGGTSMSDGQVQMLIHRKLIKDDELGVFEPLIDPSSNPTRGKYRIFVSGIDEASSLHRLEAGIMMEEPLIRLSPNPYNVEESMKMFNTAYSALTCSLPKNVHLLTLETSSENKIIIRLEHLFPKDEDSKLSDTVKVKLKGLFKEFKILTLEETNLTANQLLKDKVTLPWNTADDGSVPAMGMNDVNKSKEFSIVLNPMQIRTFVATIKFK